MARLTYFIEDVYRGERDLPRVFYSGGLYQPGSVGYYCAYCGRAWAQFAVEGQEWQYLAVTCRRCADKAKFYEHIPGSLFCDANWQKNPLWSAIFFEGESNIPPEVIRWEFHALLNHYERCQNDGSCS